MRNSKWFVSMTVLGCLLLLFGPQVWAQSLHIHGVLSRADDMALMMTFPAGTPFGFPNDYTITTFSSSSDYGNTIQWTETYTGEMTGPGMPNNIYHTPKGTLTIKGSLGTKTWTYSGIGVTPYTHMNESNTYTWDWESVCSETDLEDGNCTGETQPYIFCPMLGGAIFSDPHGMEGEEAITDFIVPAQGRNGKVNCSQQSTPPDWIGPFQSPDYSDVDRQYRALVYCWRVGVGNPPYKGLLWVCPGPGEAPKKSRQIPATYVLDCTAADKGIKPTY